MARSESMTFYEVVATLLPVLLLALVFQGGVFTKGPPPDARPPQFVARFAVMAGIALSIAYGEVVALHVLLTGKPNEFTEDAAEVSVALAGGVLILSVLVAPAVELDNAFRRPWGVIALGVLLTMIVSGVTVLIVL